MQRPDRLTGMTGPHECSSESRTMTSYHETMTPTDTVARQLRPYEYVVRPPIARLLLAIRQHCGVGGTITPGVRTLATWMNYASAGRIAPLLAQLAQDGWILYDGASGCITLLAELDGAITPGDQQGSDDDDEAITPGDRDAESTDSGAITGRDHPITDGDHAQPITPGDRAFWRQSGESGAITPRDRSRGHMVDHDLAAAESDTEISAAALKILPCAADSITSGDRLTPAAQALANLGANASIIADALKAQPDLTPQQVADTYAWHAWRRERSAGRLGEGAFFTAIAEGHIHAPPPSPDGPIAIERYAGDDLYRLGSDVSDLDDPYAPKQEGESLHDHARRIAPDGSSGQDFLFLVGILARGASDAEALVALAARKRPGQQRGVA